MCALTTKTVLSNESSSIVKEVYIEDTQGDTVANIEDEIGYIIYKKLNDENVLKGDDLLQLPLLATDSFLISFQP